ncbi:FAD-dependent oxidoreductase [Streptomonospora sp. S1-112]|uniref:FAD-dependent oxidoreductase n=1 Tax=Streptomonospora mangrovi TaxID=2883123 RepID=A0A9X3SEZ8_9ACTN|nr:FAD-dependent oxidoreductase [Streptomonospora mangrovi]MDA0564255.1 FAD-dependent oxidoreductase [Streptomonospora mangrovi]
MSALGGAGGLRFSTGPDDPALHDHDADFAALLSRFEVMVRASRRTRRRFFHAHAVGVRGEAVFTADPGGPAPHPFLAPGTRVPVLARYSSGERADEVPPGTRGASLLFGDPAHPDDPGRAAFALTLNTGRTLFARSAAHFHRFTFGTDADREEMARADPGLRAAVWEQVRDPAPYPRYHYHSQVPRAYVDGTGRPWLARYRVLPFAGAPDPGRHDPAGRRFPVTPPQSPPRAPGDDRPPTLLSDALRAQIDGGGFTVLLQVQLYPLGADPEADRAALDPARLWPEDLHPYRTVAELRFDALLDTALADSLLFDPARAPEGLGIALARSPHEPASVNHVRALVYRAAHAARTGPAPTPAPILAAPPAGGGRPHRPLTVCVIGAGPAGLSAARELERRGHRTVVLESAPEVGGKSASIRVDGRAYDLGAHICTPEYAELTRLAADLGVGTEDATPTRVHDPGAGAARRPDTAFFRPEAFARYARLRAEHFPDIRRPGLAHSAAHLARPVAEWLDGGGLAAMAASLGEGYTASGYGHLRGDLPALYFVKYAELTGLFSTGPVPTGHAGAFTVRDGFARLWRRVAEELPDVRTGVEVRAVERGAEGVAVRTGGGTVHADALVLTPALDRVAHLLDTTEEERDLAARIRTVDYRTVVFRASGLLREGFYLVGEHTAAGAEPGHLVAYHHRHAGSDVHTGYLYGADDLDADGAAARVRADVARLGGRVEEVLLVRRWPFMPHFPAADLADGVLDRFERMQGRDRTYYAGGLLGFELVETTVAYSRDLVGRFFADTAEAPVAAGRPPATGRHPARSADPPAASGPPARGRGAAEIRDWLLARISAETGGPVDAGDPLEYHLVDSLAVAGVQGDLAEWLGRRVPPTLLLEPATVEEVAHRLAALPDELPAGSAAAPGTQPAPGTGPGTGPGPGPGPGRDDPGTAPRPAPGQVPVAVPGPGFRHHPPERTPHE